MIRITNIHKLCLLIIIILLNNYCANIAPLSGGEKDIIPPEILKSVPENYSVQFKEKRIEIIFDEFIQLIDVKNKLIVSPPFDDPPEVRIKGKDIIIDLTSDIIDNTTYTMNFADAIVDFNEANPLDNFEFVFSTGPFLDSLSFHGKIYNAFDLKPEENVLIMLYRTENDSAPYISKPDFIGKTSENGEFRINNVRQDTFSVFVLKDENSNYLYDQDNEKIAFSDSLISYIPGKYTYPDTIFQDSIMKLKEKHYIARNIEMFLFNEKSKQQYIADYSRKDPKKLTIIFNIQLEDSVFISPVNFSPEKNWYIEENNVRNDSIIYWITDSLTSKEEVLSLTVSYLSLDSAYNKKLITDTLDFRFIEDKPSGRRRDQEEKPEVLEIQTNIRDRSIIDLNKNIILKCSKPIREYKSSKIHLILISDSLEIEQEYFCFKDSFHLRRYNIYYEWQEESDYRFFIEPGAFIDVFGLENDTIDLLFKTQKLDLYGNIIINVSNLNSNAIIQVYNNSDKLVREKSIAGNTSITFSYLKPGAYSLKMILDRNNNLKWDTGDYLKKIQPEKVLFYKDKITVRSNWDFNIEWDIK